MSAERITGVVKFFKKDQGYGFIQRDDGQGDIFVHYSAIQEQGFRNLEEKQRVEFEVQGSDRGPRAINVKKI